MVVGAAGDDLQACALEAGGEVRSVLSNFELILAERQRQGLTERDRLAGDLLHDRPALRAGKTAELIFLVTSSLARIIPPRGPRSVLCVVIVTTSATPTGLGMTPAAISPAGCAMSASK